ncbi:uncharacterized protein BCR38DRAFT_485548 [Pseudomassariella vexata]|uniref:DUF1763-domain-containing protein n=1 Tax=Pseudomassariella vexata TaxID=1141098 RepID=A0A1Y2DYK5_9PEZI|nr:uncharacterized protein BCR38DRAFT_485548 [Pseudomassariella vexata]ORY64390.1 hypothetical protein BCR38DRAFT_485548 [Pseudomassariella vexata]
MVNSQTIHAYRHLYRGLLHAVQFSKPARYVARDQLRKAFREKNAVLDPRGVGRTLRFLDAAAKARGLEHAVLKNLLTVAFWRYYHRRPSWHFMMHDKRTKRKTTEFQEHVEATAYKHYDMTVAMLNKSMGLCLR